MSLTSVVSYVLEDQWVSVSSSRFLRFPCAKDSEEETVSHDTKSCLLCFVTEVLH